jgi:hypothetical protein
MLTGIAFWPMATTPVTASVTATTIAFAMASNAGAPHFLIVNSHSAAVHFKVGETSTVSASSTDTPVRATSEMFFRRNPDRDTHISIRTASTTGTVWVVEGVLEK